MTCLTCGSPTPRRVCRECARLQRAAEAAGRDDIQTYPCPSCDGETSGEGVECYRCRSGGKDGDGQPISRDWGTTSDSEARPRPEVNSSPNNDSGSGGEGR